MNRKQRRGVAAVEFAIVLPIFVIMTLGMIELGRAVNIQQTLTNASREGARIAAGSQAEDDATIRAEVKTAVATYLSTAGVYGYSGVDADGNPKGKPCLDAGLETKLGEHGEPVTVTVSLQPDKVLWLPGSYTTAKPFTASSTFRRE